MAYQPLTQARAQNRATGISDAADELLGRRIGGYSPALQARFRGIDEATTAANATARAEANQSAARVGGVSPINLRRANMAATDKMLATTASGQLKQAELAGQDQDQAMQQGIARGTQDRREKFQNLNAAVENARNIGDSTTQAAAQDLFMGGAGNEYTAAGREGMAEDAAAAREEQAWLRKQQDAYTAAAIKGKSKGNVWNRILTGALGGGTAGFSAGGGWGAAAGAGAGALLGALS